MPTPPICVTHICRMVHASQLPCIYIIPSDLGLVWTPPAQSVITLQHPKGVCHINNTCMSYDTSTFYPTIYDIYNLSPLIWRPLAQTARPSLSRQTISPYLCAVGPHMYISPMCALVCSLGFIQVPRDDLRQSPDVLNSSFISATHPIHRVTNSFI